ncbi:hypothetical protein [Candidatus Lokiarchaeum ossiferum]|uniref:hypothetical protein n=1 Tax=Candidatus Lokiarchaeum ossiferum TaxID=2951803 RepID=UPI00352E756F
MNETTTIYYIPPTIKSRQLLSPNISLLNTAEFIEYIQINKPKNIFKIKTRINSRRKDNFETFSLANASDHQILSDLFYCLDNGYVISTFSYEFDSFEAMVHDKIKEYTHSDNLPPTILSEGDNDLQSVNLNLTDFIQIVALSHPHHILATEEHFCFNQGALIYSTDRNIFPSFKEIVKAHEIFPKSGFSEFTDFIEPFNIGLHSKSEWDIFMNSGFLQGTSIAEKTLSFENYLKAKESGFTQFDELQEANLYGIPTFQDYTAFFSSLFAPQNDLRTKIREKNEKLPEYPLMFNTYNLATSYGFSDPEDYKRAKDFGFESFDSYSEFKQSGCSNKKEFSAMRIGKFSTVTEMHEALAIGLSNFEDYQRFKRGEFETYAEYNDMQTMIQEKIPKIGRKIRDLNHEAQLNNKRGHLQETFRLYYLSLEKLVKLIYMDLFGRDLPKDTVIEECVITFEKILEKSIVDKDVFSKWRRVRNKFIHDNYKLTPEEYTEFLQFYLELDKKLHSLISLSYEKEFGLSEDLLPPKIITPEKRVRNFGSRKSMDAKKRKGIGTQISRLRRRIDQLEKKIETEDLELKEQNQIQEEIDRLERQLQELLKEKNHF